MAVVTPPKSVSSEEAYDEKKAHGDGFAPNESVKVDPSQRHHSSVAMAQDETLAALDTVQEEVCHFSVAPRFYTHR